MLDIQLNITLVAVGLTVITTGILGVLVLFNNRRSISNRTFFFLALVAILYAVVNYLSYNTNSVVGVLWLLRSVIFLAVWYSFFLYQFFYVFPNDSVTFSKRYLGILLPLVIFVSFLTLTPAVFSSLDKIAPAGEVSKPAVARGIYFFVALVIYLVFNGIYVLGKKTLLARGIQRLQLKFILIGTVITYAFIVLFNLILPAIFLNVLFIPLAPLFTLPFIIFTTYAIVRYKLLNIKVIATQLFVFALWIFILIRALVANNSTELVINLILFVLTVIIGILLMRTVVQEVEQRERIQKLAEELEKANGKLKELDQLKSEFVSLATHQIRGPITAIKGYTSMMEQGDFGAVPESMKETVHIIYSSSSALASIVQDFLDISRIEQGQMKYDFSIFDFGKIVYDVADELRPTIERKGLLVKLEIEKNLIVEADIGKLRQVIENLIDNAVKYTPHGSLIITAKRTEGEKAMLSLKDTGVGINPGTLPKLFLKFSRASDASKANILGTGLGLYVARQLITAMKGTIRAESEGEGKGSTFVVELPLKS